MDQSLIVIVRRSDLQATNLGQALERDIAKVGNVQESGEQRVYDGGLKDVAKRDPVEKAEESLERCFDQGGLVGGIEDFGTELEDRGELLSHRGLEVPRLDRGHLVLREVEDLFRQQAENCHVVFTDGEAGVARLNDLVDECGPVVWPFLLQNRDQDQVQFVQESAFAAEFLLGAGILDDEIDNEVTDAYGRGFNGEHELKSCTASAGGDGTVIQYLDTDLSATPSIES